MNLKDSACASLEHNLVQHGGRTYLVAGGVQFCALWVRDAAFSAGGLACIGRQDVVHNHIVLYITHLRNGTGPKMFDTIGERARSISASLRHFCCQPRHSLGFNPRQPLFPVYKDARGSRAIDSNLLVMLSLFECTTEQRYRLLSQYGRHFQSMYAYYANFLDHNGLICQPKYSDWKDSQARDGVVFLTNLMYFEVAKRFHDEGIKLHHDLPRLKQRIIDVFYDAKKCIFKSHDHYYGLDGNLMALRWNFVPRDSPMLYAALKASPLWRYEQGPGFSTYPPYRTAAFVTTLACVCHYHDTLYWSWLMALAGEIMIKMGDEENAQHMAKVLMRLIRRDGAIAEIYCPSPGFPMFSSPLYASEIPFSWGAAFTVEFAQAFENV